MYCYVHTYVCCVWVGVHTYVYMHIRSSACFCMHVLYLPSPSPHAAVYVYTLLLFLPSGTQSTLTSLQWGVADVSSSCYFNAHAQLGSYGMHVSYGNHTAPCARWVHLVMLSFTRHVYTFNSALLNEGPQTHAWG